MKATPRKVLGEEKAMIRDQSRGDLFAVEWVVVEDQISRPDVVINLTDSNAALDDGTHCPVCKSQEMQLAVAPDDRHFARCLGCGRLWCVDDGILRLVVGAGVGGAGVLRYEPDLGPGLTMTRLGAI
jgi:hypothetical protein